MPPVRFYTVVHFLLPPTLIMVLLFLMHWPKIAIILLSSVKTDVAVVRLFQPPTRIWSIIKTNVVVFMKLGQTVFIPSNLSLLLMASEGKCSLEPTLENEVSKNVDEKWNLELCQLGNSPLFLSSFCKNKNFRIRTANVTCNPTSDMWLRGSR